jgi:hypothetical protein
MEVAWLGASYNPPRETSTSSFPALAWIPGHTVSPHWLYGTSVDADARDPATTRLDVGTSSSTPRRSGGRASGKPLPPLLLAAARPQPPPLLLAVGHYCRRPHAWPPPSPDPDRVFTDPVPPAPDVPLNFSSIQKDFFLQIL